jgi:DNA-3-methyladenine glycosylase
MTAALARPVPAIERGWFDRRAEVVARELLGAHLTNAAPDGTVGGRIVEVEAYAGPEDLAAHSARGLTPRNTVMFGPPGHLYVYFIYGMHHCMNVVCGPGAKPEAVLLRAVSIDSGLELVRRRRGDGVTDARLASGPGNVARAFGVDGSLNGIDLMDGPIRIVPSDQPLLDIAAGPRIGVDYAGEWAARPMRFWIPDDPHVSRR